MCQVDSELADAKKVHNNMNERIIVFAGTQKQGPNKLDIPPKLCNGRLIASSVNDLKPFTMA